MQRRVRELALKLWHYHQMNHRLERSDALLVLCSHDMAVAERGAELFLEGWAPLLIFSGGLGGITSRMWSEPEASLFAAVAKRMGVPEESILTEEESTNTSENVIFTRRLLEERGVPAEKFILVQKPYMERRAYAAFRKWWPEKKAIVTSPRLSFDDYFGRYYRAELSEEDAVSIMVGDLQRIKVYAEKGYLIHQHVPEEVWAAYEELISLGYDRHLVTP